MTTSRIALDDVLALLSPETVIAACALDARQRGKAWRLRVCTFCGERATRGGAAIYRRKRDQVWRVTHHGHTGCAGDLLDVVAAASGIDRRREFRRLVEHTASLVGISATDPDLERRIREHAERERHRRELEERARTAALDAMPSVWAALERRSLIGERYLQGRGIDPAELRAQGDVVRYTPSGEIAVAEHSLDTGAIVGIQYRAPQGKGFRSEPYSAPEESALVGRLAELDRDGVDVAVVVEGLADSLAARLAFSGCAVFGAAGAGNLEHVAANVAKRVHEIGGWMLLTVDDDPVGIDNAADAINAARDAGLVLGTTLQLVDLGEHHDLADAYAAGWRWQWPAPTRTA